MQIIDADGHINDHACGDEIAAYMPKGNQMAKLFPEFDHLHFRYLKQNRRATGNPSADGWNEFLDKTAISWTRALSHRRTRGRKNRGARMGCSRVQSLQQLALRKVSQ